MRPRPRRGCRTICRCRWARPASLHRAIPSGAPTPLRGEIRLLTLYTRTGNIAVNQVVPATLISTGPPPIYSSGFLGTNVNQPYIEAELGAREAQ